MLRYMVNTHTDTSLQDGDALKRQDAFNECKQRVLARSTKFPHAVCFPTSIFDDTLVRAWSAIVEASVPNLGVVRKMLDDFREISGAEEVVLFERATLLIVTHVTRDEHTTRDVARFQKLSVNVKLFRSSCSASQTSCDALEVRGEGYTCILDRLTDATIVLVVFSNAPGLSANWPASAVVGHNLEAARPAFEKALAM